MPVDYVICAAGAGTRMRAVAPNLPKPLVLLRGRTLLEWSIDSLDLHEGDQLIIVAQRRDKVVHLHDELKARLPHVRLTWIELDGQTGGQLDTALTSRNAWTPRSSLVIFNADTFFRSRALAAALLDEDIDGIIPCSVQPGEAWSFCRTEGTVRGLPRVVEVAEKRRISAQCSVGYYHFRHASDFLAAVDAHRREAISGESYVAPVYNAFIAAGRSVTVVPVEVFRPMGSADQLAGYWSTDVDGLERDTHTTR